MHHRLAAVWVYNYWPFAPVRTCPLRTKMRIYIYVYTCVHMDLYVCIYVCIYVCMNGCTNGKISWDAIFSRRFVWARVYVCTIFAVYIWVTTYVVSTCAHVCCGYVCLYNARLYTRPYYLWICVCVCMKVRWKCVVSLWVCRMGQDYLVGTCICKMWDYTHAHTMGWLRSVGSIKL